MELNSMKKYVRNEYEITNYYEAHIPLDVMEIGGEARILDRDFAIGFLEWLIKVKEA